MDFILIDTNLFRAATKSVGGKLTSALFAQLRARSDIKFSVEGITAFRITPFGLLEALGIVPSKPPEYNVDFSRKSPAEIYNELVDHSRAFFRSRPELHIENLFRKHDEQKAYVQPEASFLFEACVTSVVRRDVDLNGVIASYLARDFFFKYPFKRQMLNLIGPFLAAQFFIDSPEEAPASRFRLSKRLYEHIQDATMQSFPEHSRISRSLKLKPWQDFLDADIIQEITYGFPHGGVRHRVVVLTFDEAGMLADRAIMHRQVGIAFAKKYTGDMAKVVWPFLTHAGGFIVQCDESGTIVSSIDLGPRFQSLPT